jgi:CubicO group peptidase (beta-lactamase class C family)
VTAASVYDVASLTKPTATTACLMKLVASGAVDLDDRVVDAIPELTAAGADGIRVRHLAACTSGLPAHVKFYERIWAGDLAGAPTAREGILRMTGATALEAAPGARALYSDLGFILLGFLMERVTGERLDALARRLVFEPLGMAATRFIDHAAGERYDGAAPTERCAHRGLVRGEVHDQNTHAAGGVLGQAGVFSTVDDLSSFAAAMVSCARGVSAAGFDADTVRAFFAPIPGTTRRLGWDTPDPNPGVSHAGSLWPRDGVGHLGFTGTSLWLDAPRERWVVLLTNRVHPVVKDKAELRAFRSAVMDAVVRSLDRGPRPAAPRG